MYFLWKHFRFEAAHQLPNHDGKCQRLHGHSWLGKVELKGDRLVADENSPKQGMLVDYGDIKAALEPLVEQFLDHHFLNETTGLENPTSELLAQWIYNQLKPILPLLTAVEIEETCTCCARYEP